MTVAGLFLFVLSIGVSSVAFAGECKPSAPTEAVRLAKVLDGDTISLSDGRHVRLIGVNTPELSLYGHPKEPGADQATRFARQFLSDPSIRIGIGKDAQDHYKRTLAHVYRADGGSLEEALLDAGLAQQVVFPPNLDLAECLRRAEQNARAAGRGLWRGGRFGPVAATRLEEGERGFHLLQGRVTQVTRTRSSWWIELDGRVSLRVARADWRYFDTGMPESLRGKVIEARGWLIWRSAKERLDARHPPWMLTIRHPLSLSSSGS